MTTQSNEQYPPVTLQAGERWFCDYCGSEVGLKTGVTNSLDLVYCSKDCARKDDNWSYRKRVPPNDPEEKNKSRSL